jgi:hypothetical protein
VVDTLALTIARAKEVGQVHGAIPHLFDDGLSLWTIILNKHRNETSLMYF